MSQASWWTSKVTFVNKWWSCSKKLSAEEKQGSACSHIKTTESSSHLFWPAGGCALPDREKERDTERQREGEKPNPARSACWGGGHVGKESRACSGTGKRGLNPRQPLTHFSLRATGYQTGDPNTGKLANRDYLTGHVTSLFLPTEIPLCNFRVKKNLKWHMNFSLHSNLMIFFLVLHSEEAHCVFSCDSIYTEELPKIGSHALPYAWNCQENMQLRIFCKNRYFSLATFLPAKCSDTHAVMWHGEMHTHHSSLDVSASQVKDVPAVLRDL